MSQIEVERFLRRIITDADFRARAALSLESACRGEEFILSSEEMSFLNRIDFLQFGLVAGNLDGFHP